MVLGGAQYRVTDPKTYLLQQSRCNLLIPTGGCPPPLAAPRCGCPRPPAAPGPSGELLLLRRRRERSSVEGGRGPSPSGGASASVLSRWPPAASIAAARIYSAGCSPPRAQLASPAPPRRLARECVVEVEDANLRSGLPGTENGCSVWVVCWSLCLVGKNTVRDLFWVWIAVWVLCWR